MNDLRDGVIRTPLSPMVTFEDDPLRVLRAVRFAARFGFTLHEVSTVAVLLLPMEHPGCKQTVAFSKRPVIADRGLKICLAVRALQCFVPDT